MCRYECLKSILKNSSQGHLSLDRDKDGEACVVLVY